MKKEKQKFDNPQDKEVTVQPVSGSCFWGHKWSKWIHYKIEIIYVRGQTFEIRQKRYCLRCGKMQDEIVS